jgi:hypothetical protein
VRALRGVLIVLAAVAVPVPASAGPAPVKVHLDDDGPGVSQAKEAQRLLDVFRKELERRKAVTLVESPDEADVRLVVREAEVFQAPKTGQVKTKRGGFRTPTGERRDVLDTESEIGVEVGGGSEPVLVVRLVSGDTFVDFTNEASDRTVKAAAGDVAGDITRWLKRNPRR